MSLPPWVIRVPPAVTEKRNEQEFLQHKLEYLVQRALKAERCFARRLRRIHKQELGAQLERVRKKITKTSDFSIQVTSTLDGNVLVNEPFLYYLDSFTIDLKRLMIFSIVGVRVAWKNELKDDLNFSFEGQFLNQLDPSYSGQKNQFIEFLVSNDRFSWFVDYCQACLPNLKALNSRRTFLEHGSLHYGIDKFSIVLDWTADQELAAAPAVRQASDLSLRGRTTKTALTSDLSVATKFRDNCDRVMSQIYRGSGA